MKNKKGFTLIELLAVIIILGILLLIAIPGVTGYINNSRKNVYVDTAKELIKGTSKLLNSGDFDALDPDVTYYMDSRCISNESGKEAQSPFGKFNPAYVIIVSEDDNYNYYFQSRDETEVGVKDITKMDNLQISKIVSNVKEEDIDTSVAIGETSKTAIIDQNCNIGTPTEASRRISKEGESTITLTYDLEECSPTERYYHEEWGNLCKPKRAGYKLKGWYTKKNGEGVKIKKTDLALESLKVYAYWVEQEEATFDTGYNVNTKMKHLALDSYDNITRIVYSEDDPDTDNMTENNLVSKTDSLEPIYMWYADGTIYWWSMDDTPSLNENSSSLFSSLRKLESIDELDYFDTSKVTTMSGMFSDCKLLYDLDLSEFDTTKVRDMSLMFSNCENIKILDLDSFDTPNLRYIDYMFENCKKVEKISMKQIKTNSIALMSKLFYDCRSLYDLDLSSFSTSGARQMSYMFYNCSSLETIDLSNFAMGGVKDMDYMFCSCSKLKSLDLSNFYTYGVINMQGMFSGCASITSIDVSSFITSHLTRMSSMFSGCSTITSLDISNFNTSNVTDMKFLFQNCINLKSVNISNLDTSNVYTFYRMFYDCRSLEYLDFGSFDTSSLTEMGWMLYNCRKINNIYMNNFNTSKVKDMTSMFYGCESIVSLDLSNWNTSNVTKMNSCSSYSGNFGFTMTGTEGMFGACSSLQSLDISNFDTSKITSLTSMFYYCKSIKVLDISSFDTRNVDDFSRIFDDCISLTTIYVGDYWDTSNARYKGNTFNNCNQLVGGAGTHCQDDSGPAVNDLPYAHVDGGSSNPGYFTYKQRT